MDEPGNKQQSCGNGQQRNQHSRPFFYVQPPSQPYYLYQQWQLNNPYNHYGLPAGFNLGRPCMLPYQYMQYPGFMFPHAPIYPMDYRRMFEPRFQGGPPCGDMPRHNHHHQQHHGQGRRDTACSEVQTDPSDAITKLMECLDKLRASDPLPGAAARGRELDSGIASQSSGMFSPEEKKTEEPKPSTPHESHQETPVTYRDSRAVAAYESSQVVSTKDRSWSAGLEEEPPIDSSSVHEDCPELEQSEGDGHFIHFEEEAAPDVQLNVTVTELTVPKGDAEESMQPPPFSSGQVEARSSIEVPKDELLEVSLDDDQSDQSYQILKLPLNSVLPPGSAGAASLSSPNAAYYYNYLSMQMTHERMSVLSPSLDELSSRDEMFSTDLDDLDIFPNHVYSGQRLTEVSDGPPHQAQEDTGEEWLRGSRKVMCACCGKRLAGGTTRSKAHSSKMYGEDAGDSEDESQYGMRCDQPVRAVARKQASTRKPHGGTPRHAARPCFKRSQYKEQVEAAEQDRRQDVATQEAADGKVAVTGSAELQCRTCQDAPCREEPTMLDQSRRTDVNLMSRRRQTAASVQRQETSSQWKVMYHRPRDEDHDDEPPPIHWERVSAVRGESR